MAKVMIVEDSNLMISVIRNFIQKEYKDFMIVEAKDGNEAIAKYEAEKPDLVFMDIKMPNMDGITALEKIRAAHKEAKIVMCTSLKEADQEQRAKAAGAVGYIVKPFSREDIMNAIKANLRL